MVSLLMMPLLWRPPSPLLRPHQIKWNPSFLPKTIRIDGHTIFYIEKGEGDPLLLIHGFGAGFWVWEKQIDFLSRFYRVYALDLLGHGYSDRPKIDYRPQTYISFFKNFMEGIGVRRATLIGNSMGGGIAWATALFFPEKVDRLVLIDSIPPDVLDQVKNDSFKLLASIKDTPLFLYLLIAARNRNSIRQVLRDCILDSKLLIPEVIDRQWEISRIKGTTKVLFSTLKYADEARPLKNSISFIQHPTLLIWGERDQIFPPSVGEALSRSLSKSTFQLVKGCGHIPMWEKPQEVNNMILQFLRETSE
ncbi:MAG: alpha/beta fold hydrolase [Thermodesulfobacteriota bacterium]